MKEPGVQCLEDMNVGLIMLPTLYTSQLPAVFIKILEGQGPRPYYVFQTAMILRCRNHYISAVSIICANQIRLFLFVYEAVKTTIKDRVGWRGYIARVIWV